MSEAYSRAKTAQQKGYRGAAQEHRQKGDAHKSAMENLDKRAAKIIFRENNKNRMGGRIDLHGLYVAEAVGFAKEELRSAMTRGDEVVRFIVGKGLHSEGEARIRPALEELFSERGLSHLLDANNTGVLIVRLV
jgi:DNA-nicking Smr family endonuclease